MFNINTYLEKFKNLGQGESQTKDIIIDVLREKIGVTIERKNIDMRGGVARIHADAIVKNQLYIKKPAILKAISEKTTKIRNIL